MVHPNGPTGVIERSEETFANFTILFLGFLILQIEVAVFVKQGC
jgi:hypothetical protein